MAGQAERGSGGPWSYETESGLTVQLHRRLVAPEDLPPNTLIAPTRVVGGLERVEAAAGALTLFAAEANLQYHGPLAEVLGDHEEKRGLRGATVGGRPMLFGIHYEWQEASEAARVHLDFAEGYPNIDELVRGVQEVFVKALSGSGKSALQTTRAIGWRPSSIFEETPIDRPGGTIRY